MTSILEDLKKQIGKKVDLRINDNRSTMLSVRRERDCTKVSLHRFFLEAPKNVMDSLACYVRGDTEQVMPEVRQFIQEARHRLDYSHELVQSTICTSGAVHDLREIYDEINRDYFDGKIDLYITWYGDEKKKPKSRLNLGLYQDLLRLIKIHRCLDVVTCPKVVVSFIVYHEMLHSVFPPELSDKGRFSIHTPAFCKREKDFRHYQEAENWIKNNKWAFFA